MKKILLFVSVLLSFNLAVFAERIPVKDARQVALNFYFERCSQIHKLDYSSLKIRETFVIRDGEQTLYWVFNVGQEGFVVVSANNAVIPVLAYSFETDYDKDDQAPQFRAWMDQYKNAIISVFTRNSKPSQHTIDLWNHYLETDPSLLKRSNSLPAVSPLLYSNWNQGNFYNELCPADPQGPGGHAYAGCVPTAMGQIMYYYRWPDHGVGEYSDRDTTYGILHVNFDTTWYQWNNMKNSISKNNHGIAELLYHMGVSCDLVYGPNGSGMYNHKAAYAFRTFFKYSPETQYVFRDSTNLNWDSLILVHLDRHMPLYYAGWSVPNVNGHAFVCDGYQGTDYFHFNFGWSGQSNGYFYVDSIVAGGSSFNLAQELIINIFPDTLHYSYPQYCSGNNHLTRDEGSVEDGSGPISSYPSNADCTWLIDPQTDIDSISSITLTFDRFNTSPGDSVIIYNGDSVNANVLRAFSGNQTPSPVTGLNNKMLVRFKSSSNQGSQGWSATYTTVTPGWCKNSSSIVADTLELSDGSFRFNYHNNTSCRWNIRNTTGDTLTVYFKSFDTEPDKDVLRIYDAENMDTLDIISGHYDNLNPPPRVSSPSGKMLILFLTNSSVTAKGWELYYPKSTTGIRKEEPLQDLQVFPNPAKDNFSIRFFSKQATGYWIRVSTIDGIPVMDEENISAPGKNQKTIDLSGLSAGVYFITLQSEEYLSTKKIVITK